MTLNCLAVDVLINAIKFKFTLLGKITFIIFLVQALYGAVFFFYVIPLIKDKYHILEHTVGVEKVDKIEAQIKLFSDRLAQYEKDAVTYHKDKIKNIVDPYVRSIAAELKSSKRDKTEYEDTKNRILKITRSYIYSKDDYVYIIDSNINMLSHPDANLNKTNQANLTDVNGLKVLQEINRLSKENQSGYITYWWHRLGSDQAVEKIAYYRYIPELDWIVVTGVYIDDIKQEVKSRKELFMAAMKTSISKENIGKTGYMYAFDDNCIMYIHPVMKNGADFSKLPNPGVSDSICKDLKDSVIRSNGELFYKWDKPTDKGNYAYDKVSWVRYNKDFGLYLVSSAYVDELNESSNSVKEIIILTLVGVFFISSFIALVFVRRWLIRPIDRLVETSYKIKNGNLSATSDINSNDEFETLSDAFDDMTQKLKSNMEKLEIAQERALHASKAKSEFLANMSHEIRTPMNAVVGFLGLLQETDLNEKQMQYLLSIKSSAIGLMGIINDVLDLSKVEAGKISIELESINLASLLSEIHMVFSASAIKKELVFEVNTDSSVPYALILDQVRVRQIIFNLVGNIIPQEIYTTFSKS